MAESNDRALVTAVRDAVGVTDEGRYPFEDLQQELDAATETIHEELLAAYQGGQPNLYESNAKLEMARNLLYLRFAELKRRREPSRSPASTRIPSDIGGLRRHTFEDATLRHTRDELIRYYNRLTIN